MPASYRFSSLKSRAHGPLLHSVFYLKQRASQRLEFGQ